MQTMRFHFFLSRFFSPNKAIDTTTMKEDKHIDLDDCHDKPPATDEDLAQCWSRVRAQLQTDTAWNKARLGLYFRTLCAPPTLYLSGIDAMKQHFDMSNMQALYPEKEPDLAATMAFATRAGQAALLLYQRDNARLEPNALAQQEQSQTHFMANVVDMANRKQYQTSTDDLRYLALVATLRKGAAAPGRNWEACIPEEPRWCLCSSLLERNALIELYPQTAPYLSEFTMLCELVSPLDAAHRIWYPPTPSESMTYALPDGTAL